jgi:hypothetical protein
MRHFLTTILLCSAIFAENSTVEIPLSTWEQMVDKIEQSKHQSVPTQSYCPINRSIEGKVRKGLFKGTLKMQFIVFDSSTARIPVIDGSATLGAVTLNGARTSLYRESDMFTTEISKPGLHTLTAEVIIGKELDRFDRQVICTLPEGGPTRVVIEIPEKNIDPVLNNGALISTSDVPSGTKLEGFLNSGGKLDMTWSRKLSHDLKSTIKSELTMYTLCTVQEAVISGESQCNIAITDGETDRIDLFLPDNLEITGVNGDAILQWRTDLKDSKRLIVLLRHLVQDQVSMNITFQLPVKDENDISLVTPYPEKGTPFTSILGTLSAGGLDVQVKELKSADQTDIRNLPQELTNMTSNPLLFGFTCSDNALIKLSVSRHKDVSLTGTIIDDLQASTVITQDGQEITKMKMRIRNNNRQYLTLQLPPGSFLTHSLIDGMPIRPALSKENDKDVLLFPLQQSEAIKASSRQYHTVQPGETLGDIAELYYSDPLKTGIILKNNQDIISDDNDIQAWQTIFIPELSNVKIRESSFILELAYKTPSGRGIGLLGRRSVYLASLDIETVQSLWHLYFPGNLDIVSVSSNMKQLTEIRYNLFIRARDFFKSAFVTKAWAGDAYYSNILGQRKAIYKADFAKKSREETVTTSFPLVGKKYRFRRNLSGMEVPYITLLYIPAWLSTALKWIGFAVAYLLTLFILKNLNNRRSLLFAAGSWIILLAISFYIMGMNRRYLWGIDCALFVSILKLVYPQTKEKITTLMKMPFSFPKVVSWMNFIGIICFSVYIGIILSFPMFFSSSLLVLFVLWRKYLTRAELKVKS